MASGTDPNRRISFDIDSDDMLYIAAGRGEKAIRVLYTDDSGSRWAVVPVDELQKPAGIDSGDDVELGLAGLRRVGDTITISDAGAVSEGFHSSGRSIHSSSVLPSLRQWH